MLKEPHSFILAAIPIACVIAIFAAKLVLPLLVEVRPSSMFSRLHQQDDRFDWALNLSVGTAIASALALAVIPDLTFPKPVAGTMIGAVSSLLAYVIARPPRRYPNQPRAVDLLRFLLSLSLLVVIALVLSYLIWTDPMARFRG